MEAKQRTSSFTGFGGTEFDTEAELREHDPENDGPIKGELSVVQTTFNGDRPPRPSVVITVNDIEEAKPTTGWYAQLGWYYDKYRKLAMAWMFATFFFFVTLYVILGAMFYSQYMEWSLLYSVYFCIQIIAMVGYGDANYTHETPVKPFFGVGGMWFTAIYAVSGILLLTVGIRYLVHTITAHKLKTMRERQQRKIEKYTNQDKHVLKNKRSAFGFRFKPVRDTGIFAAVLSIGMLFVCFHDGYTFTEGFYWVCITATTIGFGDLHPVDSAGYWFAIFYQPLIVMAFTMWAFSVTQGLDPGKGRINKLLKHSTLNTAMLAELQKAPGQDGDERITEAEWLSMVVIQMGFIDEDSMALLKVHYNSLDTNGDGFLTKEDIVNSPDFDPAAVENPE